MRIWSWLGKVFNPTQHYKLFQRKYKCTLAPLGYVRMLQNQRYEGRPKGSQPTYWNLKEVAYSIDHSIGAAEGIGKDVWDENAYTRRISTVDCEDFALHVRKVMLGNGFSAGHFHMAVTRCGRAFHAVLIVNTVEGYYVYDNLHKGNLVPARKYKFVKVEKKRGEWIEFI